MKKTYIIPIVIMIVLTAINLWVLLDRKPKNCSNEQCAGHSQCYISETIKLTPEQKQQYEKIKSQHQEKAILVADTLHLTQEKLMQEMIKENSDTVSIRQLEKQISQCQNQLLQLSVEQYFQIRCILSKEQIPALNKLFSQILICRPTCNHREEDAGTIPHLH